MNEDLKTKVDINSPAFKAGVEAGLNSTAATKEWQAGLDLGQTLKAEDENKTIEREPSIPLFLRDADSTKHNAQDEKDASEE